MEISNIKEIEDAFDKVVKYSQGLSGEVHSEELFADWMKNKDFFFRAFLNHQLIREFGEVSFHLSADARSRTFSNMIDQIEYTISHSEYKKNADFDGLVRFLFEYQDYFFQNEIPTKYIYGCTVIPKGMKIIRAFKYFCNNKDLLNDLQSIASMVIQNDKITGTLCLSIHPLDYLSISENQHNWRSCHALDGEYRGGNLNYMADSTTMICYLKAKHDVILPRFPEDVPWNSKKWRVLLFFNDDLSFVMAGRQYPFSDDSILLKVKQCLEDDDRKFSGWFNQYIESVDLKSSIEDENNSNTYPIELNGKYLPVNGKLLRLNKLVSNAEGTLQFNDLLDSSTYTEPFYSFELHRNWVGNWVNMPRRSWSFPKIVVGKKCNCLECGKAPIEMSESFLCNHCMIEEGQAADDEVFDTCPFCGERFIQEEGRYAHDQWGDEVLCCPDCYDFNCHTCSVCGETYYDKYLDHGLCPYCIPKVDKKHFIF